MDQNDFKIHQYLKKSIFSPAFFHRTLMTKFWRGEKHNVQQTFVLTKSLSNII